MCAFWFPFAIIVVLFMITGPGGVVYFLAYFGLVGGVLSLVKKGLQFLDRNRDKGTSTPTWMEQYWPWVFALLMALYSIGKDIAGSLSP